MNRRDLVIACLLALAAFGVYLFTLAPDVLPGDSGEFQLAVPLLGIVHPTGYPLYLLLGRLFTLLPVGSLAYRVNLYSAVAAALAAAAFYLSGQTMAAVASAPRRVAKAASPVRAARVAAAAITLALAFSPTLWHQATEAEVYALNALFVVVLLGLSIRLGESSAFAVNMADVILRETAAARTRGYAAAGEQANGAQPERPGGEPGTPNLSPTRSRSRQWLWLALVLGLSLAHHRTTILLAPVLAVYLFPYRGLRAVWPRALLLALLPLLLYAYTPLRYDASPYLQTRLDDQHIVVSLEPTAQAFVAHFIGAGFRGALRWDDRSLERLAGTLPAVASEFTLAGLLLAFLGVAALLRAGRTRLVAMLVGATLVYALFNALYQIGDISDFYTPLYILAATLMLAGVAGLVRWTYARGWPWSWTALLFALPAVLLAGGYQPAQAAHDAGARTLWQALLAPALPGGAILISNDRDDMTPLLYLQFVEGMRRDVAGLFPLISTDPHFAHVVPLTKAALQTARPVFFIKAMDGLSLVFRLHPEGALVRVLGMQDTTPQAPLARDSAVARLAGWSRAGGANRGDPLLIALYWQPLGAERRDFKTYVHIDSRDGKTLAQSDHTPGGAFYPPSEWLPGDTLRDAHNLSLPSALPAGEYELVAGAYWPDGASIQGIARIDLGAIAIGP